MSHEATISISVHHYRQILMAELKDKERAVDSVREADALLNGGYVLKNVQRHIDMMRKEIKNIEARAICLKKVHNMETINVPVDYYLRYMDADS